VTPDLEALKRNLRENRRVVLPLKIIPKSPRTGWAGALDDGTLKVRIAAPPEKGKANTELVRFLSHEFGVAPSSVEIVTGASSARKQVRVSWAPAGHAP
jgi:uncharacterized protein